MRQAPIGVYPNERVLEKLLSKLRKICLQLVNTYCTAVCHIITIFRGEDHVSVVVAMQLKYWKRLRLDLLGPARKFDLRGRIESTFGSDDTWTSAVGSDPVLSRFPFC